MPKQKQKPLNLAHRGASGHAPENTLAAFRLARELGADGLEFDVQVTKDGVPVVIHDEALVRTTGAKGYVFDHTFEEIRRLDAGSWYGEAFRGERIPSLEEVLAEFGDLVLNAELKNSHFDMPELEAKAIGLIRQYGLEQRVILSSFHHMSMQQLHRAAPELKTALLYDCVLVDAVGYAKRLGASALHPFFGTVKPELIAEAHAAGLMVNVWTVNDETQMRLCAEAGVDAIITNYPDRLRMVLNSVLD
ncbi:glycerophosphoryl diester phosphodiesterase [Tumebacillus sp. BK434]|uniref:glycerophosphodiester phosphodiesterase n=1 Tax=Tumebacillus sp. BK434 TaxID=2512169 RepID=UPI0010524065|nr:glycerophosphodiester phosphodiesterase [Tumebacillus sp. BK434]TCP55366.1 glycerophosphoryl diester phosphodiesterase [Tumebacillus sp. BK434]